MMTKKAYETLARAIRETSAGMESAPAFVAGVECCTERIADALAQTNPRFDRERFLRACQSESGRVER